ncbi:MAG: endonuclease III [Peptoniphilaceae bacterium]|nr:endonuclease III [Peptoniphilaceae bacterium]MDD7383139.1 endonuclease III [Peptoniphilaceae bacterium]MDY3738130.1 endonuclease III [Peptoniphilaceae bacterium]
MFMVLKKEKIYNVINILEKKYPDDTKSMLNFSTPFELLIATILSAQCTDVRVNKVTSEMFKNYNTPEDFCNLSLEELEKMIKSCGLYKTKAKNIKNASKKLIENFNSVVPNNMKDLTSLPGVGRKTANVVMSNAFGIDAIAVDTHVFRVSNRIGLADSDDVYKTEIQLRKNIPKEKWSEMHHQLIHLGREICKARNPECEVCELKNICEFYKNK